MSWDARLWKEQAHGFYSLTFDLPTGGSIARTHSTPAPALAPVAPRIVSASPVGIASFEPRNALEARLPSECRMPGRTA